MEQLFSLHTGQEPDRIHYDIEQGLDLTAEQALEYGLIDSIID